MDDNQFKVSKIEDQKIIVEEEKKEKKTCYLLFWTKYGNIFTIILILLAITLFSVGMGITLKNAYNNTQQKQKIQINTVIEFINGENLEVTNTYPMTEIQADKLFDNKTIQESSFTIQNYSSVKIRCKIEVNQLVENVENILDYNTIRYKISKNGKFEKSKPLKIENGVGVLLITDLTKSSMNDFKLRMWVDDKANNENQEKTFKGEIKVYFEYIK